MDQQSSASSNADTVAGLRALAAWLEEHPNLSLTAPTLRLALPHTSDTASPASVPDVKDFAEKHTRFDIHATTGEVEAVRQFGPINVSLLGWDGSALRLVRKAAGKQ